MYWDTFYAVNPTKDSFDKCYMLLVETKDFKVSIDNKQFFDQTIKRNKKPMKNFRKCQETMIKQQETYQIICTIKIIINIDIDLSKQTNTSVPQQINFTGKLE